MTESGAIEVAEKTDAEVSAHVDRWLTTGELPSELVTGHKLIDFEHRFLLGSIARLHKLCMDHVGLADCMHCDASHRSHCQEQMISLLGDVFAFILDHFKTEEVVMRESLLVVVDRALCEAHMEDHAAIAAKVQEVVASLDSRQTVGRIRDLEKLLLRWLTNHIAMHDMLLARWIARDDSLLKGV